MFSKLTLAMLRAASFCMASALAWVTSASGTGHAGGNGGVLRAELCLGGFFLCGGNLPRDFGLINHTHCDDAFVRGLRFRS